MSAQQHAYSLQSGRIVDYLHMNYGEINTTELVEYS